MAGEHTPADNEIKLKEKYTRGGRSKSCQRPKGGNDRSSGPAKRRMERALVPGSNAARKNRA